MEVKGVAYKNCHIQLMPLKDPKSEKWYVRVQIECDYKSGIDVHSINPKIKLLSEDDAVAYGTTVAKKWIDENT